jgi:large subunit ribosomal protein L9
MDVILLERIASLGQMGEVVRVRDGYARNYLLPQGKALRANDANSKRFEEQRVHLEARNLERKQEAEGVATKINGQSFVVVRQAGETGQLYGSVTTRDVAEVAEANGFSIGRNQVALNQPLKTIGLHEVRIALHPEVDATIVVNVARSEDEAARQARGEDITLAGAEEESAEAEAPGEEGETGTPAEDAGVAEATEGSEAAETQGS